MRVVVAFVMASLALAGCVGETQQSPEPGGPPGAGLSFLAPVELLCPDQPNYPRDCGGFGEPQVEVAGDGTIWYSAVCCVGQSPPIWLSHDGGATFEIIPFAQGTGVTRDAFGIEGDFAIDDAGNVYFFDIGAATAYITKYTADAQHVHTKADAFPPLVDRPWIRAGAEDEVFILYNTGTSSNFYRSTDGGLTWSLVGQDFPCPLMTLGQGSERDHLIVSGCANSPSAWISMDGGITWGERITLGGDMEATEMYMQPMADATGITYVPVTHADGRNTAISVFAIHPDGVQGPFAASSATGLVDKPWLVAGLEGVVAMAYYQADDVNADTQDEAVWHLKVTYSRNAHTESPTWTTVVADPAPVHEGAFGRALGDFLQLRQADNGDLVVAYASRDASGLTNMFVRSTGMDFGPEVFRNGPQP